MIDFSSLLPLLVMIGYAMIVGLVAPYILGKRETVGSLVPFGTSIAVASVLWVIFTWTGLSQQEWWFWLTLMIAMPIAAYFAMRLIERRRLAAEARAISSIRAQQAR